MMQVWLRRTAYYYHPNSLPKSNNRFTESNKPSSPQVLLSSEPPFTVYHLHFPRPESPSPLPAPNHHHQQTRRNPPPKMNVPPVSVLQPLRLTVTALQKAVPPSLTPSRHQHTHLCPFGGGNWSWEAQGSARYCGFLGASVLFLDPTQPWTLSS